MYNWKPLTAPLGLMRLLNHYRDAFLILQAIAKVCVGYHKNHKMRIRGARNVTSWENVANVLIEWSMLLLIVKRLIYRSSHRRCSVKKDVLRNFAKITGKHPCQVKLQAYKRDSGTGIFLWIFQNFWEHLFYRTPPEECFWV